MLPVLVLYDDGVYSLVVAFLGLQVLHHFFPLVDDLVDGKEVRQVLFGHVDCWFAAVGQLLFVVVDFIRDVFRQLCRVVLRVAWDEDIIDALANLLRCCFYLFPSCCIKFNCKMR